MQVHERIKSIMQVKKISVSALSRLIEQSEKSVYNYRDGSNEPTISVFTKIVESYPDVNALWLLTGKGDMLLSGNKVEEPLIHIGSVNHGVAGQIIHTNIAACQQEIAALKSENELLRKAVADKETIISLLQNK
jgi:hypothetical protein